VAGTGFSPIAASNVLAFNGEKAVTTGVTSSNLTSSVPQGATSGPTSLQVGTLTVLGPNFSVLPVVSDFSPKQGEPGTIVTVTGSGFDGKTKTNNMVEFNGVAGTITESTATQLKVRVPAGAENGPLKLTVNGQEVATAESFKAAVKIRTVAGTLAPKSTTATEWPADYAAAVVDADGNLYVSASNMDTVYKISPTGTLSTVAGNGSEDFEGDGGPAVDAALSAPEGLALDASGNLYIADSSNHRIRKVEASTGVITTVAGNGFYGFAGDTGPAISAKLNNPSGVAVDASGNLYIADSSNHRIRKVDASTGVITTVAGTGEYGFVDNVPAISAKLAYPSGMAVDTAGNLFIADRNNHRIRKIDAETGVMTTVAGTNGGGFGADNIPATASTSYLYFPRGVAVDTLGNLYIADTDSQRLRKVDASTGVITTVAGNTVRGFSGDNGPAVSAQLNNPSGVAVDATGNLYIVDRSNQRVRKVNSGVITTMAGMLASSVTYPGGSALNTRLPMPTAVAEAANGDLFITDGVYNALFKVSNGMIARVDTGAQTLNNPLDVEIGPDGSLYVADAKNDRILKIRDGVTTVLDFDPIEGLDLARPHDVEFDGQGNMYISDTQNDRVLKRDSTGNTEVVAAGALNRPNGIAPDAAGNLYIADYGNDRIVKVSHTGVISIVAGTTRQGYNGDGRPAYSAQLEDPRDVALDAAGNLYISDHYNNRIRKVDAASGLIDTVAGNGMSGYRGGDVPTHVQLYYPRGISLGASGTLYIADTDNGLIRAVGF
jgi:sugar lactone lactonase YvrE